MNQTGLRLLPRLIKSLPESCNIRKMSGASFPVTASIQEKLAQTFEPSHLDVINESHMHNV